MASDFDTQMKAIYGDNYKLANVSTRLKAAGAVVAGYNTLHKSVYYKFPDGSILEVFK